MSALLPVLAIAAYLTVAALGADLVGESSAGRKALPVASALWPVALALLGLVALVAAVDAARARLLGVGDGE